MSTKFHGNIQRRRLLAPTSAFSLENMLRHRHLNTASSSDVGMIVCKDLLNINFKDVSPNIIGKSIKMLKSFCVRLFKFNLQKTDEDKRH